MHRPESLARFHAPNVGPLDAGREIELPEEEGYHAARVLRLKAGDALIVFDGVGGCAMATIVAAEKKRIVVRLGEAAPAAAEAPIAVTLAFALSKGEKPDWIVRRAIELGVAVLQPLEASRSVVKFRDDRAARRQNHFDTVAVEACKQCERARVPPIAPIMSFKDFAFGGGGPAVFLLEARESDEALTAALARWRENPPPNPSPLDPRPAFTLVAGPEGGWTPEELAMAREAGWRLCSLGPRILRAETACLAILAAAMTVAGDFAA